MPKWVIEGQTRPSCSTKAGKLGIGSASNEQEAIARIKARNARAREDA